MEQFYLAYITNAFIGLAVGFVWGAFVGYGSGIHNASHKPHKARGSPETAKTDKDRQEP